MGGSIYTLAENRRCSPNQYPKEYEREYEGFVESLMHKHMPHTEVEVEPGLPPPRINIVLVPR